MHRQLLVHCTRANVAAMNHSQTIHKQTRIHEVYCSCLIPYQQNRLINAHANELPDTIAHFIALITPSLTPSHPHSPSSSITPSPYPWRWRPVCWTGWPSHSEPCAYGPAPTNNNHPCVHERGMCIYGLCTCTGYDVCGCIDRSARACVSVRSCLSYLNWFDLFGHVRLHPFPATHTCATIISTAAPSTIHLLNLTTL